MIAGTSCRKRTRANWTFLLGRQASQAFLTDLLPTAIQYSEATIDLFSLLLCLFRKPCYTAHVGLEFVILLFQNCTLSFMKYVRISLT